MHLEKEVTLFLCTFLRGMWKRYAFVLIMMRMIKTKNDSVHLLGLSEWHVP